MQRRFTSWLKVAVTASHEADGHIAIRCKCACWTAVDRKSWWARTSVGQNEIYRSRPRGKFSAGVTAFAMLLLPGVDALRFSIFFLSVSAQSSLPASSSRYRDINRWP
jgi:hypothetical protein